MTYDSRKRHRYVPPTPEAPGGWVVYRPVVAAELEVTTLEMEERLIVGPGALGALWLWIRRG